MSLGKVLAILMIISLWFITIPSEAETKSPPNNQTILNELVLINLTEQTIANQSALVLTFSQPLTTGQDYNNFITTTSNGVQVKGLWQLDANPRRLYFDKALPNTAYRVQIRPGLKAATNDLVQALPTDVSLQTKVIEPQFDFSARATILPTRLTEGLSIHSLNVDELDLEFLRVTPHYLPQVMEQLQLGEGFNVADLNNIRQFTTSVHSTRFLTHAQPNAIKQNLIPVETIPALQLPGLYFAVMRQPGTFGEQAYRLTYFIVSDLALHVRRYPTQVDIFAHTLTTGQVVPDLTIQLYGADKQVIMRQTDDTGRAHFDLAPSGAFLVMALKGNNLAFIDLRDPALQLLKYNTQGRPDQAVDIFFYSSRRLFRPSDLVELMFLIRDRDGLPLKVQEVHLRLKRPDQKVIYEQQVMAQAVNLGLFSDSFELPNEAPTGTWTVEVRLNPTDKEPINSFNFTVQNYTPEWLKLSLSSSTQNTTAARKLILALQGETFNHQWASHYPVKLRQTSALNRQPFNNGFFFGDPRDQSKLPAQTDSDLSLNPTGGAFWEVDMEPFHFNTPLQLNFNAQLFEPGGYSVEKSLPQDYWPAPALIGIKPLFQDTIIEANSTVKFALGKWDQKGKRAKAQTAQVTLLKSEYYYSWAYTAEAGWQQKATEQLIPLEQRTVTLTEDTFANIAFNVELGDYWLEVEDPLTHLKAAYPFHVGWRWQGVNAATQPYEVKMTLDKPAYKLGETVQVHVLPPSAGEAMLTVEGDQLLWFKQVHIPAEGATFSIPLLSDWQRHDLYIGALLLRPADSSQAIVPNRALGLIPLPIDRSERTLDLTIEAPSKVLPEQLVTFKIKANNLKDTTTQVFLSAVDSDLATASSDEWNPADYYFTPKHYGVEQYDSYAKVLNAFNTKPFISPLADQISTLITKTKQLVANKPTIQHLLSSPVSFNAEGEASIKLTMPSESGSLTLTALAVGEEQLGAVSQTLAVQAPVEIATEVPSFLASEDLTRLKVTLVNQSEQTQTVSLRVGTNDFLYLVTTADHDYVLEKGGVKVVELPIKASRQFGQGLVEFALEGRGFTIHRKAMVSVRSAYPRLQRSRLYTISDEDGAVTLDKTIIQNLQVDSLRARLTLSNTPELSVRASLDDLLSYPYQALESIVSQSYPYLFLDPELANNLGLLPLSLSSRELNIRNAMVLLSSLQLTNGGFAAWSGKTIADPWLSAYVADFLLDAKEQGFVVPEYLLKGVLDYLETQLSLGIVNVDSKGIDNPEHLAFAIKAYSAYVLSRVGRVSLGNLRAWYDQDSKKALSGLPLVHLGIALYQRTDAKRSREAFEQALQMKRDDTLQLGDYGSAIRDQAWSLALLLKYQQTIPALEELLKELNRQIYIRNYYTTQEQWSAVQLGRELSLKQTLPKWSAEFMLQSRGLRVNQQGAYRLDISARELNAGVAIKADPNSTVHATLEVQGYPQPPIAEKKDFFQIQRTLFDINGRVKPLDAIKVGDLVLVHLQVSANEDVSRALVVDMLPGGWILDQRLLSSAPDLMTLILEGMDKSINQLLETSPLLSEHLAQDRYWAVLPVYKKQPHHLFYLVRVVAQGEFRQPPSYVTDMDYPEHIGIGLGVERFSVREPSKEEEY